MSSNYNEEIKNSEDKNIQKLREEFDKKENQKENHPKTSHGFKHSSNNSNNIINRTGKNTPYRFHKALSANKYFQKINNNSNAFNEKKSYEFYKKHPGYLYYKEIISTLKNSRLRAYTGKILSKKMKLDSINKKDNNKINKNKNFPKINNFCSNNKLNGKHTCFNHKYNNPNDKSNPYSYFWANQILSKTEFKIGIMGMSYGVPKLGSVNKKDDLFYKTMNKSKENNLDNSYKKSLKSFSGHENKNKLYYNNFVGIKNQKQTKNEKKIKGIFDENKNSNKSLNNKKEEKDKRKMKNIFNNDNNNNLGNNKNDEKKENKDSKKDDENEFEDESFDEEQQKQFYKNQKNFFKARKDIMEEPEYLEEDNDNNEK